MEIILGIVIVVILISIWAVITYNRIVKSENSIQETRGAIQTVLQNRLDLIPNLIEVVKEYTKHEKQTFKQITQIRSQLQKTDSIDKQRMQKENELTGALKGLFAVSENYPELKANENFINLQNQWVEIEDRLQAARRTYNAAVKSFWNLTQTIPSMWIGNTMDIGEYEMYKASSKASESIDVSKLT